MPAAAETLRIATFNADLSREGPGLLARDIAGGEDPQVAAVVAVIAASGADVLLLTEFDWDQSGTALAALQARLVAAGAPYVHAYAPQPNTGLPSGHDLDRDGSTDGPRDSLGYGELTGHRGMALLSRLPIDPDGLRNMTGFLWRDLPGGRLADARLPDTLAERMPLATTAFWDVPVATHGGARLHLLGFAAGAPVFPPEAMNRARNGDEAAFWSAYLDARLGFAPPASTFVVLGDANCDTAAGACDPSALSALLADPRLSDPQPPSAGAAAAGSPLATAAWADNPRVGRNLRVDYVLPSSDLVITASGVLWPAEGEPLAATVARASPHRLVWVDVELP